LLAANLGRTSIRNAPGAIATAPRAAAKILLAFACSLFAEILRAPPSSVLGTPYQWGELREG
jgi:hypothetical protein